MSYAEFRRGYEQGVADERSHYEDRLKSKNGQLDGLIKLLSKRDATIEGLQQNIEDLAARLKSQDDDVIRAGDVVRHKSGSTYQVHDLNADGTKARFVGWLNVWSYENSFFPLSNYTKVKG